MLKNSDIAELLALEVAKSSGHLERALLKASRLAFMWPVEAESVLQQCRSLTELEGIGPHLERLIRAWIEEPPKRLPVDPLRANFITLADARAVLAKNPEWAKQLRGDLQMHTNWSDGSSSVMEMAEQAEAREYEYIGITDHSKGLSIANGMDEKRLGKQRVEIDQVNEVLVGRRSKLRVLKSIEMNLNPAGEGDMESQALTRLDLVLGSFHSSLRKKEDQTARYLAGLRNPDIQVLGHPRCRVYNYRIGLTADWSQVFEEAALLDKAVEIDSYVDRQDLSIDLLGMAREAGVRISIGTDAHSPDQLAYIELGVATALLAKISPERIVNFMPRAELKAWAKSVRAIARSLKSSIRSVVSSMPKRELINTGTDKRFVRRGKDGTFKESDDVSKSLAADRRTKAKTKVKSGQGDKGDKKPAAKKKTAKK